MIFDAHAHYDDEKFDIDRHELLQSLHDNGVVCIINAGVDIKSSLVSIEYAEKYPFIYAAVGIHPHECSDLEDDYLDKIKNLAKNKRVVAIGEIGLDYHYDFAPREKQLKVFEEQLILANELDMPIVVHDREAHMDTLNLLKKYKPKGLLHCYSGSGELLKDILKIGMSISLGGAVTFKNAKTPLVIAKEVPLDRLLLETDAPYMTPVPYRGKRCDSSHIQLTAEKIAEVREISVEELLKATANNGFNLFGIE